MEYFEIFDKCVKGTAHRFFRTYQQAFLSNSLDEDDLISAGWETVMEIVGNPDYSGKDEAEMKKILNTALKFKFATLKDKSREHLKATVNFSQYDFEDDYTFEEDLLNTARDDSSDLTVEDFGEADEILKSKLNDFDYTILVQIFVQRKKLQEIGQELGVSKSRVSHHKKRILLKLKKLGIKNFLKKY